MSEAKKILVIIDMQRDFTTGALGNDRCEATIGKIVDYVENTTFDQVIFTRDTHQTSYLETQEGVNLPVKHCFEGTKGWEVVPEIVEAVHKKYDDAQYFNKPTFGSVSLGEAIRDKYGDGKDVELTFVGVCTGICVLSNVALVKAFCPEAKLHVIADCCACVTEETHKTALNAMKTIQVDVVE